MVPPCLHTCAELVASTAMLKHSGACTLPRAWRTSARWGLHALFFIHNQIKSEGNGLQQHLKVERHIARRMLQWCHAAEAQGMTV